MGLRTITAAQAIARFESAVRAHEMKGAQPPEEREFIEAELEEARKDLVDLSLGIKLTRTV